MTARENERMEYDAPALPVAAHEVWVHAWDNCLPQIHRDI